MEEKEIEFKLDENGEIPADVVKQLPFKKDSKIFVVLVNSIPPRIELRDFFE